MRTIDIGHGERRIAASVYSDPEAIGQALAGEILELMAHKRSQPGAPRFLLGCPGGRSLRTTYLALGRLCRERQEDLSNLGIVMMDDYLVPGPGGLTHCDGTAHYSCRKFAWDEIQGVLNAGLPAAKQVTRENVWFPNPADPAAYDVRLKAAGGIDLFLIASGASDGHVAFNPPGSSLASATRIVELPQTTRRDNLATFPEFKSIDEVPGHGLTVGLATISELSARVWLVMHGQGKQHAWARLKGYGDFNSDWPVSVIFRCRQARIVVDEAAVK